MKAIITSLVVILLCGCASDPAAPKYKQDFYGNWVEDKDALPDCMTVTVTNRKGEGRAPACRFQ